MDQRRPIRSVGSGRTDIAPLPALELRQVMKMVQSAAKDFEECCNVAPRYTSISWWIRGIARLLADDGLSVMTDVKGKTFRHSLGNFYFAVRSGFDPGIDVLACKDWSRHELDHEEYGQDEELLPAFHAVRVISNEMSDWSDFFNIEASVDGPLTLTVVAINVFAGGEGYWQAASNFEKQMTDMKLPYAISTKATHPGILAPMTVVEPMEPFQILIASKTLQRPALKNLDAKTRDRR